MSLHSDMLDTPAGGRGGRHHPLVQAHICGHNLPTPCHPQRMRSSSGGRRRQHGKADCYVPRRRDHTPERVTVGTPNGRLSKVQGGRVGLPDGANWSHQSSCAGSFTNQPKPLFPTFERAWCSLSPFSPFFSMPLPLSLFLSLSLAPRLPTLLSFLSLLSSSSCLQAARLTRAYPTPRSTTPL